MSRWDCSGGEKFESRGLERQLGTAIIGLVRQAMGCPSAWKFAPPPDMPGYLRGNRGTPNHRFGLRDWYYGWAMRAGTEEQKRDARDLLCDFFEQQTTTDGHMLGELLSTSHYWIWLYDVMAARFLARHYKDAELLELTGQWLRRQHYLDDLLLVDDAYVVSPGARPAGTHLELRTVFYWLTKGKPAPPRRDGSGRPMVGIPNKPGGKFWIHTYNVGAWLARNLINDGDDLGGTTRGEMEIAQLRDPLYVYRRGDDYVFSLPHFTKSGPVVLPWTSRINGVERDSQEYRGRLRDWDSPSQAPGLPGPGATLTVVCGAGRKCADIAEDDEEEVVG